MRAARRVVAVQERNHEQHRSNPFDEADGFGRTRSCSRDPDEDCGSDGKDEQANAEPGQEAERERGPGDRPAREPAPSFGGSRNRTVPSAPNENRGDENQGWERMIIGAL